MAKDIRNSGDQEVNIQSCLFFTAWPFPKGLVAFSVCIGLVSVRGEMAFCEVHILFLCLIEPSCVGADVMFISKVKTDSTFFFMQICSELK